MTVEFSLWRVDGTQPQRLSLSGADLERRLQHWLVQDLSIVAPDLLLIGREVHAFDNERIDILAIDRGGKLYALELKRDIARREAVAQLLDYGAWIAERTVSDLQAIFEKYAPNRTANQSLDDAFQARFCQPLPDALDESHELWLVVAGMDDRTKRVCEYLANHYELPINAVFVHFVRDGDREYLARAWLRDPNQSSQAAQESLGWNREFYASFGEYEDRSWEEARKFGFFAAGGGPWYSRTLKLLNPGDRIWVRIPGKGYVGVGKVLARAVPIDDFTVEIDGTKRPIVEVAPVIAKAKRFAQNPENAEYVVAVDWIKTVPISQAVHETGLFGNQNSVARPRAESWVQTVTRLKQRFGIAD